MKKRSFFERLTGAINTDDDVEFMEERPVRLNTPPKVGRNASKDLSEEMVHAYTPPQEEDAQLTIDMYQTPDDIIIKTIVAGVNPQELDVTITREMVTIAGRREGIQEVIEEDYFHKELYWGGFSRTILLPEEVDVEMAEAVEKHGILTLRLPKIDKQKKTKLSVKSS